MPRRNVTIRNSVARSPLLRKGSAHMESKTGQRVQARISTNVFVDEWMESLEEEQASADLDTSSGVFQNKKSPHINVGKDL